MSLDLSWLYYVLPVAGVVIIVTGIIENMYNKSQQTPKNISPHQELVEKEGNDSEDKASSQTEDKVTKVSMDNYKTKAEHPMGDKTHD